MSMISEILIGTLSESSEQPSFFEITILEQMSNNIRTAMYHIMYTITDIMDMPQVMDYFEQLFFVFSAVLEIRSLFNTNKSGSSSSSNASTTDGSCSFIESIYGYRRVSVNNYQPLSSTQKCASLAYMLLVPRLIPILKSITTYLQQEEILPNSPSSSASEERSSYLYRWIGFLHKQVKQLVLWTLQILTKITPYLLSLEVMISTLYKLCYALELTSFHHPIFHLLEMKLVKTKFLSTLTTTTQPITTSNTDSMSLDSITSSSSSNINNALTTPTPSTSSSSTSSYDLTRKAIMVIFIMIRLTDWYLNTDLSSENIVHKLACTGDTKRAIPPPPKPMNVAEGGIVPPQDARLCAICGQVRSNPCAVTSGYVFCYRCILPVIRARGCCPITHLPCRDVDLIRIYENSSTSSARTSPSISTITSTSTAPDIPTTTMSDSMPEEKK